MPFDENVLRQNGTMVAFSGLFLVGNEGMRALHVSFIYIYMCRYIYIYVYI